MSPGSAPASAGVSSRWQAGAAGAGAALLMGLLLAWVGPACSEPELPPSFIVISLDTTRADRLGVYGHSRDTTPNLDALAARGLSRS